jgi:dinuclear metal center YbgI/SA1388 family protein
MTLIKEIIAAIDAFAPPALQEDYDNCGLLTGDPQSEATGALLTLDCTEDVVEEAIKLKCNLIIAHHPVIFSGLKKLSGNDYVRRTVVKAIRNDIAIYACHTSIDNVKAGVNHKICEKLGLKDLRILLPKTGMLKKLATFVPLSHHEQVLQALFSAGAGNISNYDSCSFNLEGTGTFRGNAESKPFIGKPGELSREKEIRIETIYNAHDESAVVHALRASHPYEEIAYDLYSLSNAHPQIGSGMTGELEDEMDEEAFLKLVKKTFKSGVLKHTNRTGKKIKKVAVCGGSGRFLLKSAIGTGVHAFITSDFKYHEFFDADGRLLLIDTGHYESEQYTPELFYEIIRKKFSKFAVHLSKTNTNPVNYF